MVHVVVLFTSHQNERDRADRLSTEMNEKAIEVDKLQQTVYSLQAKLIEVRHVFTLVLFVCQVVMLNDRVLIVM